VREGSHATSAVDLQSPFSHEGIMILGHKRERRGVVRKKAAAAHRDIRKNLGKISRKKREKKKRLNGGSRRCQGSKTLPYSKKEACNN